MINDDETTPDPTAAADYIEKRLHLRRVSELRDGVLTSVGLTTAPGVLFPIDIKARRKLTSQSIVLLTYRAVGGTSDEQGFLSGVLRCLTSVP